MAKLWRYDESNDKWVKVSEDEPLPVVVGNTTPIDVNIADGDVTINASDIEIGAVELKDATTDTRAVIGANGLNVVVGNTTPLDVEQNIIRGNTLIIDDASFTETVTSSDIDMEGYRNAILTVVLGAKTGTPTMTPSVEVKDSNGNYITFDSLPVMSAGSEGAVLSLYDLPDTVRVVCTYGGTGNFAGVTVEYTAMN